MKGPRRRRVPLAPGGLSELERRTLLSDLLRARGGHYEHLRPPGRRLTADERAALLFETERKLVEGGADPSWPWHRLGAWCEAGGDDPSDHASSQTWQAGDDD